MPPSILSKSSQQTKSNSSTKRDDVVSEPKFPIRKYDYMEGRNYRRTKKQSAQFLPCDDEEIERLQVNHLLYK
jgi:hypothetical protein